MSESWRRTQLPEIAVALASRPGHDNVRALVSELLRHGFGAAWADIDHEIRLPEVHGRVDMLFGATVFEFKKDLRQEWRDVQEKLPDYLRERERQSRRRFLGIATDGASFIAYELRDGLMTEISRHETRADRGDALLAWLEPALSERDDLRPEPLRVQRELGRDSLTFGRARGVLTTLWERLREHPEVIVKRQLWDGLLREVYGTPVGNDDLFLQHSYLTIVAKTIAARVLDLRTDDAHAILSGQALMQAGINGAVESDFFDWVLLDPAGVDLVRRIARQASRFRLRDAEVDLLKGLYESLIDPAQRHDLGEYYTPDWLAAKLTRAAVQDPLRQTVLDPACGSGTFLFHAVRALLAAAALAGWSRRRAVEESTARVRGLDIHPVAVIIARVTWLLALGEAVRDRPPALSVPVFLGDALQWNLYETVDMREVRVNVPGEKPLSVPAGFAENQQKFEPGLRALSDGLDDRAPSATVRGALGRIPDVSEADARAMAETFDRLVALRDAGKNHIWPFVLRNLVRPLMLSRPDHRADVLLGNPPWVAYRYLSAEMQPRLREACVAMDLWVGGVLATQQDVSALFWARCAERYLKPGGTIAFVLPYAALNRPAFAGLRRGAFRSVQVRIVEAWSFDETVQPLFPVPACALIGKRERAGPLPAKVLRFSGFLPRRDAHEEEADRNVSRILRPWPPVPTLTGASAYRARFKQGATIVPRRLFLIEREEAGRFGPNQAAPRVHGKTGKLDKAPWSKVEPPSGAVEVEFLRPVILGETIGPFRLFAPATAVIPAAGLRLLDAGAAASAGHRHLAHWLRNAEAKWFEHCAKRIDGSPNLTLLGRLDYMHGLSQQLPASSPKVVYAKAGTLMCAATVADPLAIVDHMAYWTSAHSAGEARYLCAVLNSEEVRRRVAPAQAKGQGGARHFDNLMWELPIPEYDRQVALHRKLAEAGKEAEELAATVPLAEGAYFTRNRRAIRDALAAGGISARIDTMVAQLLER